MTRRVLASRSRRNRFSQRAPDRAVPRETQADWWAWTFLVARQLERLPSGRLVTEYRGFDEGVSVLLGQEVVKGSRTE